jgi:peptidoglycan/xylan/chitin deacetylase (PgdA/CDA1 family)
MSWLEPVRAALDVAPADVFFRDDDAGWRDDRLFALLRVFDEHDSPLDVAVIPAALTEAAAAVLRARAGPRLGLHQHGFAHRNHEPVGRKHEFGPSRSRADQRRDIEDGAARLRRLLGDALDADTFTPPWNRCTEITGRCLRELGFRTLSRESGTAPLELPGLRELPVDVDWCRLEPAAVADRLAAAIAQPRPAGVMLHHAVMDAADRARVGDLLTLLQRHGNARRRLMREL